jgi:hypothetical protein
MRYPTQMPPEGAPEVVVRGEDSSIVVAMNVVTRKVDTLAKLSVGYGTVMRISYNNVNQDDVGDLFPQPDDWAVMSDGSIAIFSGREYRVRYTNVYSLLPKHRRSMADPRIQCPSEKAQWEDRKCPHRRACSSFLIGRKKELTRWMPLWRHSRAASTTCRLRRAPRRTSSFLICGPDVTPS